MTDQTSEFSSVIEERRNRAVSSFEKVAGGLIPRNCPICDYRGMFTPFGQPPRLDAHCAKCGSLERHRMLKLLLTREALITDQHSILHFAPERSIQGFLAKIGGRYVTADLMRRRADIKLDIEAMDLPDCEFDRVICFQILEHVDDARALSEIYRVLTPGGIAFLNTPVIEGWDQTYENAAVSTQHDRVVHFGQGDHVRYFGRDLRDRMKNAGFSVREFAAVEPDVKEYGLWRGERIFIAQKPAKSGPAPD